MNQEQHAALRAPFPAAAIGKLPRITCRVCRDAQGRACGDHPKTKCDVCDNYISPRHIHLDYVGHADLTDRLLSVDAEWSWEPMGTDANGAPLIDNNGGMWIRLTVAGVTRIGYGHPDGKKGGDAVKEAIGDALRNAAMRFGVALDLWKKEPAQVDEDRPQARQPTPSQAKTAAALAKAAQKSPADEARAQLFNVCTAKQLDPAKVANTYFQGRGIRLQDESDAQRIQRFTAQIRDGEITVESADRAA